jgi:hypothetical protein
MRARRWSLTLAAAGLVGSGIAVIALPGSARADTNRFALSAQGDSMYFQIKDEDIPLSPRNESGSLTAFSQLDSNGASSSFAGAPFYGKSAQAAPGTINSMPNQFGYGQTQLLPFSEFPGYVAANYPSRPTTAETGANYSVRAVAEQTKSSAAGSTGAPPTVPAPNQQQNARASTTKNADGSVLSEALGQAEGVVIGPLEVGNSQASAKIVDNGDKPIAQGTTFGRFEIGGQQFGFDQNGLRYLGQSMSQHDALKQANSVLTNAGMQLDIAPIEQNTDATSGAVTYTIGGLKVTTTQTPPGGQPYTFSYILGRATVSSVNVALGAAPTSRSKTSPTTSDAAPAAAPAPAKQSGAVSTVPESALAGAANVPPAVPTQADQSPADQSPAVAPALPRTLGFVPSAQVQSSSGNAHDLYLMLLLAGLGLVVAQQLFGAFAVRMVAARRGR